MYQQKQQPSVQFNKILKKVEPNLFQVHQLIEQQKLDQTYDILESSYFQKQEFSIEIKSLKAYVLILKKDYDQALITINQCLEAKPYHLTSKKRKALILQKLGDYQQCIKQFQSCLYLEPESKSIRNKIKRLTMSSSKSESMSSEGNTFQEKISKYDSINSKDQKEQKQQKKQKNQTVKFGKFQVIQIVGTEDSDEHFAIIKQQINKLSDKKPKKSILKDSMSASVFKQKPKNNTQKSIQLPQKTQNQEQKGQKIEIKSQNVQKPSLKKKAKSVTFKGDTNLEDFN